MLKILLISISAVSIPTGCSPFCFPLKASSASLLPPNRGSVHLNNEMQQTEITGGILQSYDRSDTDERIELWLDLRGTTITPKMAIEMWKTEIEDGQMEHEHPGPSPNAPFSKCLISFDERQQIEFTIEDTLCSMDVLMVGRDGYSFKSIYAQPSDLIGTIVSLKSSQSTAMPLLPDPLSLIEKYSNGEWILFDTKEWKKYGEDEKLGMLFPLVELVGSVDRNVNNGRIGWTCHSRSEVIKSAMWKKCQPDISTKTLDSGIVIPGDEIADGRVVQNDERTKYVITVPYDSGLLRAAMSLINDVDGNNG
ncbi:hypothetical protein ACHAW6_000889 [Cyclotella cf. meneghiniana]